MKIERIVSAGRGLVAPCLLLCLALAAPAAGEMTLEFGETTVTASGVTPGAETVVFAIDRTLVQGMPIVSHETYRLADEDGDGTVLVDLGEEVPWRSLWIAFDLTSGAHAVDQATFGVREVDFAERGLRHGAVVEYRREMIFAVMARAHGGLWALRAGDGGPSDFDGAPDGKITIHPQRMTALAGSPPPPGGMAAQDLIVVIDPRRMKYAVVPEREN